LFKVRVNVYFPFLSLFAQRTLPCVRVKSTKKGPLAAIAMLPTGLLLFFGVGDPSFVGIRVRKDANAQVTVLQVSGSHDLFIRSCSSLLHY
jgi:hypothetical protein